MQRRREILRYGALGVATALGYGLITWYWLTLAGWLLGHEISFVEQPPAIRFLKHVVDAIPWALGAGLLIWAHSGVAQSP